uniref:(northern house mosquito) hypothetical protein n=1 Tax=Culex pipiens TaxID=7175 RepID=A0A8D8P2W0_CULPI
MQITVKLLQLNLLLGEPVPTGTVPHPEHPPGGTPRRRAEPQIQHPLGEAHPVPLVAVGPRPEAIVLEPAGTIERPGQCPPAAISTGQAQQWAHLVVRYGQPGEAVPFVVQRDLQMVRALVQGRIAVELDGGDIEPG